jgi:NADH-quinone oxidoreductase subunit H
MVKIFHILEKKCDSFRTCRGNVGYWKFTFVIFPDELLRRDIELSQLRGTRRELMLGGFYEMPLEMRVLHFVFIFAGLLVAIAYYTLAERKIMAAMQRRKGPDVTGLFGLLQPIADGFKLLTKEIILPYRANKIIFVLAPCVSFVLALLNWIFIPFSSEYLLVDKELGALFVFAISSLGVYGIILAGWASNSKYALLGALRASAQMISYEVSMSFILVTIGVLSGSYNFVNIVEAQGGCWYVLPLLPLFVIFFISGLAETNRTPFDLPEGESEIASGYNLEYSGILFALFFLAEYSNMLLICALTSIYFLGGWTLPYVTFGAEFIFSLKIVMLAFVFVWVRATVPRYRYDHLLFIGWKTFLPISFGYFVFIASLFYSMGAAGVNPYTFEEYDLTLLKEFFRDFNDFKSGHSEYLFFEPIDDYPWELTDDDMELIRNTIRDYRYFKRWPYGLDALLYSDSTCTLKDYDFEGISKYLNKTQNYKAISSDFRAFMPTAMSTGDCGDYNMDPLQKFTRVHESFKQQPRWMYTIPRRRFW